MPRPESFTPAPPRAGDAWPRPYEFRIVRDCHSLELPWFEQRVASFMTNHMGCLRPNARMVLDGISICASATVMRPRSRHSSRILSESSGSSGSSSAGKHSVSMFSQGGSFAASLVPSSDGCSGQIDSYCPGLARGQYLCVNAGLQTR